MTKETFESGREVMKGSPALRDDMLAKCIRDTNFPGEQEKTVAKLMNVKPGAGTVRTFCTRLMGGFASGRITYEDLSASQVRDIPPPNVIRVLQGR